MSKNFIPISIPRGVNKTVLEKDMRHGSHSLALKDRNFVRRELTEQLQTGPVAIFSLVAVKIFPGLCIFQPATITQTVRKPLLIYGFFWSILNNKSRKDTPKEAMRFERELHRLTDCMLVAELS